MKCDDARRAYSVAIDGELAAADREQLDAHMSSCPSCTAHAARLVRVRQQLRFEPVEDVPDVLPRVLGSRPGRRRPTLLVLAATFVACFVAGASFVGFGPDRVPTPMAYADIRDGLPSAQRQVRSLHTTLRIVERGWHPRVPVREYAGTFDYAAPESLWLRLRDRTKYPSAPWARNDVDLVVDRDSAWWRGPAPCPVELQPSCTPANARVQAFSGRDPFSETAPAPLDLVVPVRSFTGAASAPVIGTRRIAGREALEIRVGAAQVAPLLDALRRAGNWREINPAD
ncbi:MAG: zf-HC2 domain-containing protein, partial [Actinomycetota bacterium]